MFAPALHHVLVGCADTEKSRAFYRDVLELREISRPNFPYPGAWFQFGGGQHLHLMEKEGVTGRAGKPVDTYDVHFALGASSFNKTMEWLASKGYREDLPADHVCRVVTRANSIVGRPQIYIMDPDHNIIEFICDAME